MSMAGGNGGWEWAKNELPKSYEEAMIAAKARNESASRKAPFAIAKGVFGLAPGFVKGNPLVRGLRKAYLKANGKEEQPYAMLCMQSFVNYLLNREPSLPEGAGEEYASEAQRIVGHCIKGALGGGTGCRKIYGDFYSRVKRRSGHYELDGVKLCSNTFYPEVFFHHHGLKRIPEEALGRVRKGAILDIGAANGDSACVLSRYTDGKVYSFECDSRAYGEMERNIALNRLENVVPVIAAIGQHDGTLGFDGFPRDFYFHHRQKSAVEVKTVSVDGFCSGRDVGPVSLIKMDIEGFELEAVLGARHVIARDRPVVIASVYHTGKDFFEVPLELKKLNPGYRFMLLTLNDEVPTLESTLVAY